MNHDRIHAREPSHDADEWQTGTIREIEMRDGHVVFTVRPDPPVASESGDDDENDENDEGVDSTESTPVELVVTTAIRDLVLRRLPGDAESPVGQRVWYKRRGR